MMRRLLLAIATIFVLATPALALDCTLGTPANTCYWIGGTGTWDGVDTTHWSFTTGGVTCVCAPASSTDKVVFDGSSGGGTTTIAAGAANSTITIASLTTGAHTGTITAVGNNNIISAATYSLTGAGTKTLNTGSSPWLITGTTGSVWDCTTCTNLTLTASLKFQATPTGARTFVTGSKTYASVEVNDGGGTAFNFNINGFSTITTFIPTQVRNLILASSTTFTNGFTINGTAGGPLVYFGGIASIGNSQNQVFNGTTVCNWCFITGMAKTGTGTLTGTNSFDGGSNTGLGTITPPATGGGRIIGG